MTTLFRVSIVAAVCTGAAGCSASYPTASTKADPVALYLAYAAPKGRTAPGSNNVINAYSFIAYTIDRDGAYERVTDRATWSSSDDGIARPLTGLTPTATKTFLAVSPGDATVIARFQGLEATAPMLIVDTAILTRIPRIELAAAGPSIVGSLNSARVFFRPPIGSQQDVTNSARWSSSNPDVATVDRGAIRAISSGTTIIAANFEGLVDWFWFSVIPKS